jgi:hypothetical protein
LEWATEGTKGAKAGAWKPSFSFCAFCAFCG